MDADSFFITAGAVVFGNALSFVWAYFLWKATKAEQRGGDIDSIGFGPLLCGIIPPAFVAWTLYLLMA